MKKEFPYIVKPVSPDEFGVNYVVEYIDFPGITGGGDTVEEAISIANEAMEMYLETLSSEGRTIPSPTNFNTNGRVTLRIPKTMHLRVIEMSEREGVSLNTYITDALAQKVYSTNVIYEIKDKLLELNFSKSLCHSWVDGLGKRDESFNYILPDESTIPQLKFGKFFKQYTEQYNKEVQTHAFSR